MRQFRSTCGRGTNGHTGRRPPPSRLEKSFSNEKSSGSRVAPLEHTTRWCAGYFSKQSPSFSASLPLTHGNAHGVYTPLHAYGRTSSNTLTTQTAQSPDLVGFFNSVPQDQVCAAVAQLLAEHQRDRPSSMYSEETHATAHHNRVFAGKQSYGRTPKTRIIHMEDIMTIVKSSFQGMYVQVGTLIMHQVHGTAIGSQLSPVLSHICVARHEVIWQRIYGQWYTSHNVFLERYVDNRFVIFPSPSSGHPAPPLEALLQADFYGAPIVLEQVGSSEFLGFVIDVGDRSIYYKTPTKIWQIRGPRTAGSLSILPIRSSVTVSPCHQVRVSGQGSTDGTGSASQHLFVRRLQVS